MAGKFCYWIILFLVGWGCSPTNLKITYNPKKVGIKRNESILITPLPQVRESENEELVIWANDYFKTHLPFIRTIDYWDAQYNASQYGIALPSFNSYDTISFQRLREQMSVDFILGCTLEDLKENYTNELNNPNYQRRKAIVTFQLLDLANKRVAWYCTTRVLVNPFKINGRTQEYSVNILSGSFAVKKAYKESVNRLIKSIVFIN